MTDQVANAEQEVRRGQLVDQLLNNEVYASAMTAIRADLFQQYVNSKSGIFGRRKREELHRQIKSFDRMQTYFESVVQTGKLGSETISLLNRNKKLKGL